MKKLILFLVFILFIINFDNTYSAWYGSHLVSISWNTWCDQDWDTTWLSPTFSNSPSAWSYTYDSRQNWLSWTSMYCEYWDWSVPESLSVTYTAWWTNSAKTITLQAKDRWWSKLKKMILQESTNWWAWTEVANWDNLNFQDTVVTKTRTKNLSNWNSFKYKLIAYDYAGNYSEIINNNIIWFDNTDPTTSDIINISPTEATPLLANDNKTFSFQVSENWGSPIKYIGVFFENYNTENNFLTTIHSWSTSPWSFAENIRNVDLDRISDGSRTYSLRVSRICDEAWNCSWVENSTSDIKTFNYKVYADTSNIAKTINSLPLTTWNIANWQVRDLSITLKDQYNNWIVPASWINRTIDFNWNVSNSMYLNQYTKTWNSVFVNRTTDSWNYLNRFSIWSNLTYFNWEVSNSWSYNYSFKVYTPTSNQDSIYWKKSDKDAEFKIISLNFDINDTTFWDVSASSLINNLTTKFNPLYYTEFSGDIKTPWFVEWANQSSSLSVNSNWTILPLKSTYLEF